MKNTFRYIVIAASALLLSAVAFGQTKDEYKNAIKTKKTVEFNEETGVLERLVLETFVTGDGLNETIIETTSKPMDAILVLDHSTSMMASASSARQMLYIGNSTSVNVMKYYANLMDFTFYADEAKTTQVKVDKKSGAVTIGNSGKAYVGPVYVNKQLTRLEALKVACLSFVDIIEKEAAKGITHTVSLVSFGNQTATILDQETDFDLARTKITELLYDNKGNGTRTDNGMASGYEILSSITRESTKVVVMFTDGDPTNSGAFDYKVAGPAVNTAKSMKDAGAYVYSIATLDSEPAETSKTYKFLQGVSSNYLKATAKTEGSDNDSYLTLGDKNETKFYKYAKNADELKEAFETISKDVTTESSKADVALKTEQVTVVDVIAPEFQIPAGADKITFFSAPATMITGTHGSRTENDYTWGTEAAEPTVYLVDADGNKFTGTPSKNSDGKTYVSVKGFDFNQNWVGTIVSKKTGEEDKTEYHGRKLLIKIEIEPDPEFEGGFVTTNSEGSGVYVDGDKYQGITSEYEVDPIKVLSPKVNLIIKKSGLNPGETILYTVTRKGDGYSVTVPLTADASGTASASVKADAFKSKGVLWEYVVTEDGSWAWEYEAASTSQSHALYKKAAPDPKSDKTEDLMCNVFDFGVAKLSDGGNTLKPLDDAKTQTRYHEAAADNNFKEVSKVN